MLPAPVLFLFALLAQGKPPRFFLFGLLFADFFALLFAQFPLHLQGLLRFGSRSGVAKRLLCCAPRPFGVPNLRGDSLCCNGWTEPHAIPVLE